MGRALLGGAIALLAACAPAAEPGGSASPPVAEVSPGESSGFDLRPVGEAGRQGWRQDADGLVLRAEGEGGKPWTPLDRNWRVPGATSATLDADGAWRVETPGGPLRLGPARMVPPSKGAGDPVLAFADGVLRLRRARRGDALAPVVDLPVAQPQTLRGAAPGLRFGDALIALPDLDGDGDAELVVATRRVDAAGGAGAGLSLHLGSPGGLLEPSWTWHEEEEHPRAASLLAGDGGFWLLTWPDPGQRAEGPVRLRRFAFGPGGAEEGAPVDVAPAGEGASWFLAADGGGLAVGRIEPSGAVIGAARFDAAGAPGAPDRRPPPRPAPPPGFTAHPDADCALAAEGRVEHASGWRACGGQVGARFGERIARADFTGDELEDVAIAAPLLRGPDGGLDVGAVRIWRGTGAGFTP